MDVGLSRRVGILHPTNTMLDLKSDVYMEFTQALSKAKDFDSLDKKWKTLIIRAEKGLNNAR